MRTAASFLRLFRTSPFGPIVEHAEVMIECGNAFKEALDAHFAGDADLFEEKRILVDELETKCDMIKRRLRGHLPKGTMMPVDKFQVFRYIREQDGIPDSMEEAVDWLSFRLNPGIPQDLREPFLNFISFTMDMLEPLYNMTQEAKIYFEQSYSQENRNAIKGLIHSMHQYEHEADILEDNIKRDAFNSSNDPVTIFHMVRLAEIIGDIADSAQNCGDWMRAMVAK